MLPKEHVLSEMDGCFLTELIRLTFTLQGFHTNLHDTISPEHGVGMHLHSPACRCQSHRQVPAARGPPCPVFVHRLQKHIQLTLTAFDFLKSMYSITLKTTYQLPQGRHKRNHLQNGEMGGSTWNCLQGLFMFISVKLVGCCHSFSFYMSPTLNKPQLLMPHTDRIGASKKDTIH